MEHFKRAGFTGKLMFKCVSSRENLPVGFPTSFETNQAVQPQKMARGLKILQLGSRRIVLVYLCSENKNAHQHMQV